MNDDADKEEIKHANAIREPANNTWTWLLDDKLSTDVNDIKRQLDEHQAREAEALVRGEEPLRIVDHIGLLHKHGRLSLSPDEISKLKEMGLNLSLLTNPEVKASRTAQALLADTAALKTRSEAMSAWWYEKVARPMLNQMLIERRKNLQTRMLVALRFHAKTKQEQQKAQQREWLKLANIDDAFLDAATGDSVVKLTREAYDDIMRMHSTTDDLRVRAMCAHVLDCDDGRRYNAQDLNAAMHVGAATVSGCVFMDEHEAYMHKDTHSSLPALFDIERGRPEYTVQVVKPRPVDIQCKLNVNYDDLRIDEPGGIVIDSCPDYMRDTAHISCDPVVDAVGYDFTLSGGGQSCVGSFKTGPNLQTIERSQMKAYEKLFSFKNPLRPDVKVREIDHSTIVKQTTTITEPSSETDSRKYRGPEHDARRKAKKLKRKAQKQQRK